MDTLIPPTPPVREAPLNHIRLWKPWGGGLRPLTHDTTSTFAAELDSSYRYVRLWFGNDTDRAWRLDGAAVAPSASLNDGVNPVSPDGRRIAWRPVRFGPGVADGVGPQGQGTSALIPASDAPPIQKFVPSDWIDIESLPRTDGGHRPVLFWRTYVAGTSVGWIGPPKWNELSWHGAAAPKVLGAWARGNALAATAESGTRFAGPMLQTPVFAIQYLSTVPGITMMICGDSIEMGQSTVANQTPFLTRAAWWLWTPGRPVSIVNMAYGGKPTAVFGPICRSAVRLFRPTILMYPLWTPNDPWQGGHVVQAQQRDAADQLGACSAPSCLAVALTPAPQNGLSDAYYAARDSLRTAFLQNTGGRKYLDLMMVYGDPAASYDRFRADFTNDGLHPNDAGADAAAALAAERLRHWIDRP